MRGDLEWGTIPDLVAWSAEQFGPRDALVDGDVTITFSELAERAAQAAGSVAAAGIGHGDRVAIWAPNIWEWIVAALGVLKAGGVVVPVNTRFKGPEAVYILERSGAQLLFTVEGFLDTDYVGMLHKAGRPPSLETVVVMRGETPAGTTSWDDFLSERTDVEATLDPDALSDIIFTSGTTGAPKGVMTTHGQTLRTFEVWSRLVGLAEGDRYLVVNPFFHTFGYKAGFLSAIMRGATTLPHAVFDAGGVLERIAADRITMLPGPPTLYQSILNHPERGAHDLSSLRLAVTGAATIPVSLIERMRSELGFDVVLTAYGLTEATGVVTMCRPDDDAETIATTSGSAIPDTEVRVVDDDGKGVPRGEPGEIVVRGFNVMQGYLDDPEQTAEAVDAAGWLHTGDIGVMDDRGYVRITDRKKDMFIVGGFNVYPAEVENELSNHPSVAQAAVIGVPDERLGEVGCAFVVRRQGAEIDPDEVMTWARERMANYKVPRRIEVIDALPLNASGKVLKYELRERVTV